MTPDWILSRITDHGSGRTTATPSRAATGIPVAGRVLPLSELALRVLCANSQRARWGPSVWQALCLSAARPHKP